VIPVSPFLEKNGTQRNLGHHFVAVAGKQNLVLTAIGTLHVDIRVIRTRTTNESPGQLTMQLRVPNHETTSSTSPSRTALKLQQYVIIRLRQVTD
jgi:hypothetical protein